MFAVIAEVTIAHSRIFILKNCTEIKTSRGKSMFLVPNLYAKNLSAPDDSKYPYETRFVKFQPGSSSARVESLYDRQNR